MSLSPFYFIYYELRYYCSFYHDPTHHHNGDDDPDVDDVDDDHDDDDDDGDDDDDDDDGGNLSPQPLLSSALSFFSMQRAEPMICTSQCWFAANRGQSPLQSMPWGSRTFTPPASERLAGKIRRSC